MPFLPTKVPITDRNGFVALTWLRFFQDILRSLSWAGGSNRFDLASQPSLKPADAGFVGYVSDYGHFVRWSGTAWTFTLGDNGTRYFQHFAAAPDTGLWALCDGTATTYLAVGATLTAAALTTPDLTGTLAVLISGPYTGSTAAGITAGITLSVLASPVYVRR